MEAWQATVQDEAGNSVFNPQITVYESDGVTLASIYNEDGSPKDNPFTGTLEGFAQFWAGPGVYKIRGANGGQTELWESDLGTAKLMPYQPFESRAQAEGAVITAVVQYITVNGRQFIRDPEGTAITTGGGITWSPVDTIVHPEDFGAPTGTLDDSTPAFQRALEWTGQDAGRKLVDTYGGVRYFDSAINLEDLHVRWDAGCARYVKRTNTRLMVARVTPRDVATLTADYIPGSNTLSVSGLTEPLQEGDWIRVASNAVNPYARGDNTAERAYRVREVARVGPGSTLTSISLGVPLRFVEGVEIGTNAIVPAVTVDNNVRVVVYNTDPIFEFSGGFISYAEGENWNSEVIRITGYYRPRVTGLTVSVAYGPVIANVGTISADIRQIEVGRVEDDAGLGQYGYPINDGGYRTKVTDCNVYRARNAYTTQNSKTDPEFASVDSHYLGGNIVGAEIVRGRAYNCLSTSFNTHHEAWDVTFTDCYAEGGVSTAFTARGFAKYIRPVGRMLNDAISASTEYRSGNYVAGKHRRFATKLEFIDADIECTGQAFGTNMADLTFSGNNRFVTSFRQAARLTGRCHIRGDVSLVISDNNGSTPIGGVPGANCIEAYRNNLSEAQVYYTDTRVIIYPGSTLRIETSEASYAAGIIGAGEGAEFVIDGYVSMNLADGQSIYSPAQNVLGSNFGTGVMVIAAPDESTISTVDRTGRGFGIYFEEDAQRVFPASGAAAGLGAGMIQGQPAWPTTSPDNITGALHGAFYSATTGAGWPVVGSVLYLKRASNNNAAQILFHADGISMRTASSAANRESPNWTVWREIVAS